MPKVSEGRFNRMVVDFHAWKALKEKGQYLGHTKTVSDDGRITVYAYSVDPKEPEKVTIVKVGGREALLAAMNESPANPPNDPNKPEAEEKPDTTSKKK